MKISCISCGHKIDLGDAYDDYEGPVKCYVCGALLAIKAKEGSLKTMGLFSNQPAAVTGNNTPPAAVTTDTDTSTQPAVVTDNDTSPL
ncbi:hypothetical protein JWG39_15250 [Desulforhopalus vacuolatus]|uniref:hypothetical protein n=1 Tax=Desulforhopalus vacuolatus TaxID=40414 RepID=UPI0019645A29|nr:hypothetical protein [Desulforhopalus vacuolatus]MBM9521176.1 hypothetical protein [Desulforhopalus vacuolatus]